MEPPSLGDQELELLRFVADHAPASARDMVEGFGASRGLARSTVLTVVDRLTRKGYLTRRRNGGVFQYSPRISSGEVLQGVVRQFIQKTLRGSISPVVAYLANEPSLTDEELKELERLVEELKTHRQEKRT